MKIGSKLRVFAENNFGSVSKLAELLGMKPPSFYKYLNDESVPGGEILAKLVKLGCDVNWLLEDDDRSPPEVEIVDRVKELEEENRLLRDNISRICELTQAIDTRKKLKQSKPFKK